MSTAPSIDLRMLDQPRPTSVDPAVFPRNLAALAVGQPELARVLRDIDLPAHWQPVFALDGSVTWRIEEPGQPPRWLGQSAAPAARAHALLGAFDAAGKNPALPCLGSGAELRVLLDRLPRYAAVFVFEPDVRVLAAVLRTLDLSTDITAGRCLLVPPGAEAAFLDTQLAAQPGLLPPGDIVLPGLVDEARVNELRTLCERVLATTTARREEHLRRLAAEAVAPRPWPATPRLAVLALAPDRATHVLAAGLERAAQQLGWAALVRALDGPQHAQPLAHCQTLRDFDPDLTLCVNHPRTWLPVAPPGRTAVWVLTEAAAKSTPVEAGVLYLAASPLVADTLRGVGVPADALRPWYWACDPATVAAEPGDGGPAVLVADLLDLTPKNYGVTHSTHELLWQRLRALIAEVWQTPLILEPEKLLTRAERACRLELRDETLRSSMLELMTHVLIPGVIVAAVARVLAAERGGLRVLGRGWERWPDGGCTVLAADVFDIWERSTAASTGIWVFAGQRDPLGPALLWAAAGGRPALVHSPGGRLLNAALGDVLRPGQHLIPFAELSELRRVLRRLADAPTTVIGVAQAARRHVLAQHTYAQRLVALAERGCATCV